MQGYAYQGKTKQTHTHTNTQKKKKKTHMYAELCIYECVYVCELR